MIRQQPALQQLPDRQHRRRSGHRPTRRILRRQLRPIHLRLITRPVEGHRPLQRPPRHQIRTCPDADLPHPRPTFTQRTQPTTSSHAGNCRNHQSRQIGSSRANRDSQRLAAPTLEQASKPLPANSTSSSTAREPHARRHNADNHGLPRRRPSPGAPRSAQDLSTHSEKTAPERSRTCRTTTIRSLCQASLPGNQRAISPNLGCYAARVDVLWIAGSGRR